jgi:hypothetical protein
MKANVTYHCGEETINSLCNVKSVCKIVVWVVLVAVTDCHDKPFQILDGDFIPFNKIKIFKPANSIAVRPKCVMEFEYKHILDQRQEILFIVIKYGELPILQSCRNDSAKKSSH